MSERAPYSRVYWTVRNDPRLADIYPDDHHWATWNRLLLAADMAWPAPADLPLSARRASVSVLEAAGVIELLPGGMFRFHGLDAERGRRSDTARASAAHRSLTERGPNADRTITERSASRAEPSQAEPSLGTARDIDPADTYWTLAGKYPTDTVLAWIDDLSRTYGTDAVSRHLAARHIEDRTARTLMGRVRDSLKRDARQLERAERDDEERKIAAGRKGRLLATNHSGGWHDANREPECPLCHEAA